MYRVRYGDPPVVRHRPVTDHESMARKAIRVLVELCAEEHTLTGRLTPVDRCEPDSTAFSDERTRDFSGWLGLLSALDAVVIDPPPGDRPPQR